MSRAYAKNRRSSVLPEVSALWRSKVSGWKISRSQHNVSMSLRRALEEGLLCSIEACPKWSGFSYWPKPHLFWEVQGGENVGFIAGSAGDCTLSTPVTYHFISGLEYGREYKMMIEPEVLDMNATVCETEI